jgi:hypothetical protein
VATQIATARLDGTGVLRGHATQAHAIFYGQIVELKGAATLSAYAALTRIIAARMDGASGLLTPFAQVTNVNSLTNKLDLAGKQREPFTLFGKRRKRPPGAP